MSRESKELQTVGYMALIEAHIMQCELVTMYDLKKKFGRVMSDYSLTKSLNELRDLDRVRLKKDRDFGPVYVHYTRD